MKRAKLLILVLFVGAGIWWLYRVLFPPDEAVIRRLLVHAAEAASVPANERPFDKLKAVNRLVNSCTADIEILLHVPGVRTEKIQGREQLREAVAAVRATANAGAVTLMDIGINVEPGRSRATAQFIARARWDGATDEVVQEFKVDLNRAEGEWKIRRVEPLQSLGL